MLLQLGFLAGLYAGVLLCLAVISFAHWRYAKTEKR